MSNYGFQCGGILKYWVGNRRVWESPQGRKIVAVYCENHKKPVNAPCGQNAHLHYVKKSCSPSNHFASDALNTEDSVLISVAGAVTFLSTLRCRHLCTDKPARFSLAVYWSNVLICLAQWLTKCLLHITEKWLLLFRGHTTSSELPSITCLRRAPANLTQLRYFNMWAVSSAYVFHLRMYHFSALETTVSRVLTHESSLMWEVQ